MGLDITFSKNDSDKKNYFDKKVLWGGTELLYFRKREDILADVIILDEEKGLGEEDVHFCGGGEQLLGRKDIEYLAKQHKELIPLLEFQEVVCWWVS